MKITQRQLIDQIKTLKEIRPRKEWAVLLKSQILAEKQIEIVASTPKAKSVGFVDIISSVFSPRKLAYSFAVILFLVIGVFGFYRLLPQGKAPQQTAALTPQPISQQNTTDLNTRINDLANATKQSGIAMNDINTKVSALAKSLKNTPVKDSQTIEEIAKTLADVPGTDLIANKDPDVNIMYQTVVQSQIADLQKTTLTDDQKNTLAQAEDLYNQGKYTDALEEILLINK